MRGISLLFGLGALGLWACGPQPTSLRLDFTWAAISVDQIRFQVMHGNTAVTDPLARPDIPSVLASGAQVVVLLPDNLAAMSVHVTATARSGGHDVDSDSADATPVLHQETGVPLAFGTPVTPMLAVTPNAPMLGARGMVQLQAMLTDQSGTNDVSSSAAWVSSSPFVASVAAGGMVTAHNLGQTKITAMASGLTATSNVTVSFQAPQITSLDCTPATVNLMKNQNQQLTATAHYQDGSTANVTSQATFTSSDRTIVDVNTQGTQGQITGKKTGDAQITAALSGFNGVCMVHVN